MSGRTGSGKGGTEAPPRPITPFPELAAGPDGGPPANSETPSTPRASPSLPRISTRQPDLDLSSEIARLHGRAPPFVENLSEGPLKTLLVALSVNTWLQLGLFCGGLLLTCIALKYLVPNLAPPAFAFFLIFLVATLHFSRTPLTTSLPATLVLVLWSILLYSVDLYQGFKPAGYFLLSLLVVGTVSSLWYNALVIRVAEQNTQIRTLRNELRSADQISGMPTPDAQEQQLAYVRQSEDEIRELRKHYSSLLYHLMMFGGLRPGDSSGVSGDTNYNSITRATWQVLKHGLGAERAEILFLDPEAGQLYCVKAFARDVGPATASATPSPFIESAGPTGDRAEELPSDKMRMTISLREDNLFGIAIDHRRMVLRREIEADPLLRGLERKTPCPVHTLVPLVVGEQVLGVINISDCSRESFSEEDVQLLRITAQLASLSLSHAQIFLQTKEELEAAKVLTKDEREKRAEVLKVFKTLVSSNIVDEILENPDVMNSRRQKITVMFVDLRGFTSLSEKLDASIVVDLLNDFFEALTPILFRYGGTLDKYIGDEIMALFGAPFGKPDDTRNAVLCAVEMKARFEQLRARWHERAGIDIGMGIAINTGEGIIGSLGSSAVKNFTAIGDVVNTAARLEGLSGRGQIFITRSTYDEVCDHIVAKQHPSQHVKGKEKALEIFEVLSLKLPDTDSSSSSSIRTTVPVPELASPMEPPPDAPAAPPPPTAPQPSPSSGFGSSRDLASRASTAAPTPPSEAATRGTPPPPRSAAQPASSRDLARQVSGKTVPPPAQAASTSQGPSDRPAVIYCPVCNHENRGTGLSTCEGCRRPLMG